MKQRITTRISGCTASLLLALTLSTASGLAQAVEVAGVNFQPQSSVKGTNLQLNGAGVRRQGAVPLYTAGLYLQQKTDSAEEVLASQGAKQIRVVMLRAVNSRDLGALLSRGLVTNSTDDELSNLIPEIMDIGTLIAERRKLKTGDSFVIEWSATQGTTIRVMQRGTRKAVVEVFTKPDVINALLRIWLGSNPADADLKAALLGKSA
jgi:Chalcone isomerase-like